MPYDVLLDTGNKLLRVQVKTTEKPRLVQQRANPIPAYVFSIKRAGSNGKTRYNENEIDLFALVCLDTMRVAYVKNKDMPTTINIRVDAERGSYHDEKGEKDFKIIKKLSKTIKNQSEISRQTGIAVATVNRYLKPNYKPFKTKAKYFSDLLREKKWFYEV